MPWDDDDFIEHELDDGADVFERPHGVRFGEGQPINRLGRPRGSPNMATIVKRVAKQRHRITINGVARTKGTVELLVLALQKKAAEGNLRALKTQQSLLQHLAPRQRKTSAVLIISEKLNEEEWEAVHGDRHSDEEVKRRWPWLVPTRTRHRDYLRQSRERSDASAELNGSESRGSQGDK